MSRVRLSRRFALGAVAAGALGAAGTGSTAAALLASAPKLVYRWQGVALGARASVVLAGAQADRGAELELQWQTELRRLERIFSLYMPDSALCRLNREGVLHTPPLELVELLSVCSGLHRLTAGTFDPTVQALWQLHASHFARFPDSMDGPDRASRARALAHVGLPRLQVSPLRLKFATPGMSLTLNGIAQGYVTDRITALLLRAGVENALVNIGEVRGIGHPPGRGHWRVGRSRTEHGSPLAGIIEVTAGAVATSSAAGFRFGANPRHHHLFDHRTGTSAVKPSTVTVTAGTATLADGLSTAFTMMPPARVRRLAKAIPGVTVYIEAAS